MQYFHSIFILPKMWNVVFILFVSIHIILGAIFSEKCPGNIPEFNHSSVTAKAENLRVLKYLPIASKLSHLFYPKNVPLLSQLFINLSSTSDRFALHKFFSAKHVCNEEEVNLQPEGHFTDLHIIVSKRVDIATRCEGVQWDMYQLFAVKEYFVIWGCVNLKSVNTKKDISEQGAWILGHRNETTMNILETIHVLNFTKIKLMHFFDTLLEEARHLQVTKYKSPQCERICQMEKFPAIYWPHLVSLFGFFSYYCTLYGSWNSGQFKDLSYNTANHEWSLIKHPMAMGNEKETQSIMSKHYLEAYYVMFKCVVLWLTAV